MTAEFISIRFVIVSASFVMVTVAIILFILAIRPSKATLYQSTSPR